MIHSPDPLAELAGSLERRAEVPREWIATHAPDGDLQQLWHRCTDPRVMLRLLLRMDPGPAARAAIACARLIAPWAPASDGGAVRRTLETVEAWCDGRASIEQVRAVGAEGFAVTYQTPLEAGAVDAAIDLTGVVTNSILVRGAFVFGEHSETLGHAADFVSACLGFDHAPFGEDALVAAIRSAVASPPTIAR